MKIIKIINTLFYLTLITSCNTKIDNKNNSYFYFDELEYYHKDISDNDVLSEYKKSELPNYDKDYLKILENEYPINLNDSLFIQKIIKFGYKKKKVEKSNINQINQIFSKKKCTKLTANGCIPIYRDILIFKQNGKTVGVAKVCFDCNMAYIIGSKQNWDYFGECGDYEKLKKILKQI